MDHEDEKWKQNRVNKNEISLASRNAQEKNKDQIKKYDKSCR